MCFPRLVRSFAWVLVLAFPALAQSPNGNINGLVSDPASGLIAGADVVAVNDATGAQYLTKTNSDGIYVLPSLPPGPYRLQVSKVGFKTIVKPDIVLNVQDALSVNFTLPLGALHEIVTVEGGAPLVNTENAAVSTVVDRQFVENMPLNGRSFQTLLTLTPGVVLTPVVPGAGEQGQFTVNGQRAGTNYFTVDGVSANAGSIAGNTALNQVAGGSLPAFSALGGTNSLVSVDAMQEFRIQTSSFAPEFGRSPGAQISIVTRSGTNDFHGTLFDYFRNNDLDANDWFSNHDGLPKPQERQNDFGGVLGGRILRNRTFFFFSYEGLRLRQPSSQETVVPDRTARQQAPASIQPYLNVFSLPNGAELGGETAQYNASYSNPSSLDAYSIRVDHNINSKLNLFVRYNYSPSNTSQRGGTTFPLSTTQSATFSTQTLTTALLQDISNRLTNEFRANYSNVRAGSELSQDGIGGAVPLPESLMFPSGFSARNGLFEFDINGVGVSSAGNAGTAEQRQLNLIDNFVFATGLHQLKFGVDYRLLSPFTSPDTYTQFAFFSSVAGQGGALSGIAPFADLDTLQGVALISQNFSLYGQDTWKATPRLTLTYGLRWDLNPPLRGANASDEPFTVVGLTNPATMTLAPRGTPLYHAGYGNVAPRVGLAYQLRQTQSRYTILRAGGGVYYDFGAGALGGLTNNFPFFNFKSLSNVAFPLTANQAAPPALTLSPPVSSIIVADPNLKDPRTYEWNVALEQSLGSSQAISATYVGALGRDLFRGDALSSPNNNFGFVQVTRNTATSDYHALQTKFERRLARGLQALASYTFSHSIDIASSDLSLYNTPGTVARPEIDRGNSSFDVRHSFTAALSYDVPNLIEKPFLGGVFSGWSLDSFVTARSALPVDLVGGFSPVGGTFFQARPDVVPGAPLYLYGSQFPGGKGFNMGAFTIAPAGQQGDFARNQLRGFEAWQADFALRRKFNLTDRVSLQFHSEFFNILNHPNFGNPNNQLADPLFGKSSQTLATSMGSGGAAGGFNPLYQIGGPRSIQLALKLAF